MPQILEEIEYMMPEGSIPDAKRQAKWAKCPIWPPDLFAVTAFLVEKKGLYTHKTYTNGWSADFRFDRAYLDEVRSLGDQWYQHAVPPNEVQDYWDLMLDPDKKMEDRHFAALKLMAIADEAAIGVGFFGEGPFEVAVVGEWLKLHNNLPGDPELPYYPDSLCKVVPADRACVQPKSSAPSVGVTLRSLSHHLALLPPRDQVKTNWVLSHLPNDDFEKPLNVLLVPFPYHIDGRDFSAVEGTGASQGRFFGIRQSWLHDGTRPLEAEDIGAFLVDLIGVAEREVHDVHAVVLPELALTEELARGTAEYLASRKPNLELFVSGVSMGEEHLTNAAFTARLSQGQVLSQWHQNKHHRWKLEKNQIRRYHLGHSLDPNKDWWEKAQIQRRECVFSLVRPETSLAVLVCEDLARADPVMPALNAMGPNLLIALLMDGPQMERRWPGRYATVLADDPGCSVLTLTCLGMIARSCEPGAAQARQIALWKDPDEPARELSLSARDHGLLLSLTASRAEQYTLDGRTDYGATTRIALSAARGIRHATPPGWVNPVS